MSSLLDSEDFRGEDCDDLLEKDGDMFADGSNLYCTYPGCNKMFNTRWSLTRHIRTHTGERPFKCQVPGCNKEFVQKCSLIRHEQTHLDGKPWICDSPGCGKRFKLKEYLDVHKKTHAKMDMVESKIINNYNETLLEKRAFPEAPQSQYVRDFGNSNDPEDSGAAKNKDPAQVLIRHLRQRVVNVTVKNREQRVEFENRERELIKSLKEVTRALEESISLLNIQGNLFLPPSITETAEKYRRVLQEDEE